MWGLGIGDDDVVIGLTCLLEDSVATESCAGYVGA